MSVVLSYIKHIGLLGLTVRMEAHLNSNAQSIAISRAPKNGLGVYWGNVKTPGLTPGVLSALRMLL